MRSAALKLANGLYINDYTIGHPWTVDLITGQLRLFKRPKELKAIIENHTNEKVTIVSNSKNRTTMKRIAASRRLIESLKKEGQKPILDRKKINEMKTELENINKKIR